MPTGSAEHRGPMRPIGTEGLTVEFIGYPHGEKTVTAAVKDLSQTKIGSWRRVRGDQNARQNCVEGL